MVNEKVCKKLIEVAKKQGKYKDGIITYSDLNIDCNLGIAFEGDAGGKEIGEILGDISKREYKNNRPLLSVVVVLKGAHPPITASGFFELWEELGLRKKGESREIFFAKELARVHDYWSKH